MAFWRLALGFAELGSIGFGTGAGTAGFGAGTSTAGFGAVTSTAGSENSNSIFNVASLIGQQFGGRK